MDWQLLRQHKCPKCTTTLQQGMLDLYIYCQCGFTISQEKYEKIMTGMITGYEKEEVRDNQAELNNL